MNKVLLVEDENDLRKIIANYLKQANFTVVEAADGEQALSLFADGEYDLVILDLMLPKVNGYEVRCRRIYRQAFQPQYFNRPH